MSVNGNGLVALDTNPQAEPVHRVGPAESVDPGSRILVLAPQGDLTEPVSSAVEGLVPQPEVVECRDPRELGRMLTEQSFDVLVAGPGLDNADGLERLRIVREELPNTALILMVDPAHELDPRMLVRTGAIDLLDSPPPPDELSDALNRALQIAGRLHGTTIEQHEPIPREIPTPRTPGRVLSIASASGGSGKTFLSTNLAWFLSAHGDRRVCIIDLDLRFGEVSTSLQLKPQFTVVDLLRHADEHGGDLANRFSDFCEQWVDGVSILAAPRDPAEADHIQADDVARVIEAARANFDDVIIDTPPALSETFTSAIAHSDEVMVLATLDIPSIRNMQVFLTSLQQLATPTDGVHLLLNKAEPDSGVEPRQLVKLFPQGFDAILPYAREVQRSVNAGQPVLLTDPQAPVSRQLGDAMVRLVSPDAAERYQESMTSGRASRFRRRKRQDPT